MHILQESAKMRIQTMFGMTAQWSNNLYKTCFTILVKEVKEVARKEVVVRIAVILISVLLMLQPALSRPEYMKNFKDFPDEVKKCTLCHVQSSGYGGVNSFGADFAKIRSLTPELMQLDSDSDRFSNIEELRAGTMPGDPESYPGKKSPDFTLMVSLVALALAFVLTTRKI